jgi:hypothetical protein
MRRKEKVPALLSGRFGWVTRAAATLHLKSSLASLVSTSK